MALLSPSQRPQLSSGTTSNEVLNHELNARFRNVPRLYQATLKLNCEAFQYLKLITHNTAEYMPTDYQVSQQQFLNHYVCSFAFSSAEWLTVLDAQAPLFKTRSVQAAKVAAVSKKKPRQARRIKRQTFNKRPVEASAAAQRPIVLQRVETPSKASEVSVSSARIPIIFALSLIHI